MENPTNWYAAFVAEIFRCQVQKVENTFVSGIYATNSDRCGQAASLCLLSLLNRWTNRVQLTLFA